MGRTGLSKPVCNARVSGPRGLVSGPKSSKKGFSIEVDGCRAHVAGVLEESENLVGVLLRNILTQAQISALIQAFPWMGLTLGAEIMGRDFRSIS